MLLFLFLIAESESPGLVRAQAEASVRILAPVTASRDAWDKATDIIREEKVITDPEGNQFLLRLMEFQ